MPETKQTAQRQLSRTLKFFVVQSAIRSSYELAQIIAKPLTRFVNGSSDSPVSKASRKDVECQGLSILLDGFLEELFESLPDR